MLPPLDPDFLISVHDLAQLDEYATDLLQHWRAIREGKPANGYGVGMVKAAADWLLARYAEVGMGAPADAVMLWHEVRNAKPTPRARTGAPVQERLLPAYIEAYLFDAAEPEAPTLYSVARHVRATSKSDWSQEAAEAAIGSWRKRRHYQDQVRLNRRTKG